MVIDEPKLKSYFQTQQQDDSPYFIVIKLTRPCRNGQKVYARLEYLKQIYQRYGMKRFFVRKGGEGDGIKGIIAKYHFSADIDLNHSYPNFFRELNSLTQIIK